MVVQDVHCSGCLACLQCQVDLATDEEMFAERELELAGLQEQVSTLVGCVCVCVCVRACVHACILSAYKCASEA